MSQFRVPHTLVLLYGMLILAWLLTLILPAGNFETMVNDHGREVVIPGTFTALPEATAPSFWALFSVIPRGLEAAQGIIFFVFIIGGALAVIRSTGALDAALARVLERFGGHPALLIIMGMLAFGVGSSTIGMAEEYIPLIAILITLCVAMRMDTVAALGIVTAGYAVGFGTAMINPFTVLVAQEVAGLAPTSGMWFRALIFLPFLGIGFIHVWRYTKRIQADPEASLVYDIADAQPPPSPEFSGLSGRQQSVLWLVVATLVLLVWGITRQGWYLVELGAVFVALSILVGLVCRMGPSEIARQFSLGAAELTGTALLIGFARAIELMLSDGQVLHTIVNALATPLQALGSELSAVGMLLIQSMLNLFIPSGSGQAYVTMPLMAPIADIVGVSRQVAVLAYQMGDGFMNIIVPTNPVLMGMLGICGIPYSRWLRFIWPLIVQFLLAGAVTLVIAVMIGYQ